MLFLQSSAIVSAPDLADPLVEYVICTDACNVVGGHFSVPPRTVWICCFLGSPVWDLGPELVGCRLFAPWDLNPLALDFLACLIIRTSSDSARARTI